MRTTPMKTALSIATALTLMLTVGAHASIVVTSNTSAIGSPPSFDTGDLGQTQQLSTSGSGGGQASTESAQLFNGVIGNTDGDTNDNGEVSLDSSSVITIDFDISTNTQGYDLTGLNSVFGWATGANGRSNQGYEVVLTYIDNSTATLIGPQTYEPNTGGAGYWTKVQLDNAQGGVLTNGTVVARGVKTVTYQNFDNANAGGVVVARELDIEGVANTLVVGEAQINSGNVAPSPITAVSGDLLETSVASVTGENAGANVRNGTTGTAGENSGTNPATAWGQTTTTYNLDLTGAGGGYEIFDINVFSGWNDSRSAQSYQIFYSLVGESDFIQLGGDIIAGTNAQESVLTRTYNADGSAVLYGVDAIRFVQINGPLLHDGTGTVYREFDVIGKAIPAPAALPAGLALLGFAAMRRRRR